MDVVLVDTENYANMNPNPFVLTSVVPFYSIGLVMPSLNNIDKSNYFTMPFDKVIWMIHAIFPIYYALALEIAMRKSTIMENILEGVRVIAKGNLRVPKTNRSLVKIIYLLTISYSILMSMMYTSYLGCFLTRALGKTDFVFVCTAARIKILSKERKLFNFLVQEPDDYYAKLYGLDMNYGYCVTSIFRNNAIGFKNYMKPIFRSVIPWKFVYGHYLRINQHSKHLNNFNSFLLNAYSTGLMKKWGK